ncbi:MAG: serine/threonine protein kinase [Planctomycetota bacterium]|jgi:serine/threonine protein kinase
MSAKEDLQFLALLVHRGHLTREEAEQLVPPLRTGGALNDLLIDVTGRDEAWVEKMRRTQAGEIPEIPGYEVLGRVGHGGTADVFRVREKKGGRTIALKVLNPQCTRSDASRKAFIAEAKLLQSLKHTGLVSGLGVARSGSTYFTRMEFIDGNTLLEILDRGQALDEGPALRIILEVSDVLSYLHSEGVIHRDVKPGNIMLTNGGKVKLIDLGFAAEANCQSNPEDSAVGTVAYLSPEQARGGATADLRSDIYSIGVTLFQLVVGRLPFDSSDDREVLRMQIKNSLSSPELKGRKLSPHLHYFIEKMMAKDKGVRYQSWEELVEDIQSQLKGRETLDYRQATTGRSSRRKNPKTRR